MKSRSNKLTKGIMVAASMMMAAQLVHANVSKEEYLAKLKLARASYATGILAEKLTKDYMYLGNNIGTRQIKKEFEAASKKFDEKLKVLDESINDQKSKNLLTFMQMSVEELKDLMDQPYSLDNAQVALDLSQTILEGSRFIADRLKKSVDYNNQFFVNGIRAYFESIPKYYIAYQSGIKDENTVKQMKDTVKAAGEVLDGLAKSPLNTVAMNQKISKIKRLWSVVYKFYLDIDEGGLPFIVYKTSEDLNKNLIQYMKMADEARKAKEAGNTKSKK